jgi:uncharacterized membrane protein
LGYICLELLVVAWAVVALIRSRVGIRAWVWLTHRFGGLPDSLMNQGAFSHKIMVLILGIYILFALGWYGGIAQGTALKSIINIEHSQRSLVVDEIRGEESSIKFIDPKQRETLIGTAFGLDFASVSSLGKGFRIFQYLTELFILVGFFVMIFRPKNFNFKSEYIALIMGAILILLACIALPRLSSYLNVSRFYHITLFLLSPLFILGAEVIWRGISKLTKYFSLRLKITKNWAKAASRNGNNSDYLKYLVLPIIIPYFLFTTGFLFEIIKSELYGVYDAPSSWSLSGYRLDMPIFNHKEVQAASYLVGKIEKESLIYGDEHSRLLLIGFFAVGVHSIPESGEVPQSAYIFLRTWNMEKDQILTTERRVQGWRLNHVDLTTLPALLNGREIIYDNGGAQILGPR